MSYPHGGKYSNDPYFVTAEEEQVQVRRDQADALPPGTQFTYLGRPCVVLRYADEAEAFHTGVHGTVYEYADERGQIHKRTVAPRDFEAFRAALTVTGS